MLSITEELNHHILPKLRKGGDKLTDAQDLSVFQIGDVKAVEGDSTCETRKVNNSVTSLFSLCLIHKMHKK